MIFRKKRVKFSAWNYDVVVVITDNFNDAAKKLKLILPDEPPPARSSTGGITCHDKNDGQSYLFVKPKASVNIVTHESWHCVRRMLIWTGADFDSETVAYHLGYLSGKVHEFAHKEIESKEATCQTSIQK